MAYGIKDNGFAYFLLLFYTAVVGLDPALAGLALLIALLLDGLGDPILHLNLWFYLVLSVQCLE